jgi:hypothetical protein
VGSAAESSLEPKRQGQGGRNQQKVVEIAVEKNAVRVLGKPAPVGGIEGARNEADRISRVAVPFHNSAQIRRPVPNASRSRMTNGGRPLKEKVFTRYG